MGRKIVIRKRAKTIGSDKAPLNSKIIKEDLSTLKELARLDETEKISIYLSKDSLDYFKKQSIKYDMPYQKMIRQLLDEYVKFNR